MAGAILDGLPVTAARSGFTFTGADKAHAETRQACLVALPAAEAASPGQKEDALPSRPSEGPPVSGHSSALVRTRTLVLEAVPVPGEGRQTDPESPSA